MHAAQLRSVRLGDPAEGWAALGFELSEHPLGSALWLGSTEVVLTGSGAGFEGWSLDGIEEPIDGLAVAEVPSGTVQPRASHPNGIRGIDHIVFSSGDLGRTVAAFEAVGIDRRGGRSTDSYGSPMRQVFFWLGDVILELVGPGDDSAPGAGDPVFLGLALWSDDLDATVSGLGELAGTPRDAVQSGRRIAGLRGSSVGVATPLAVMSPHVRT